MAKNNIKAMKIREMQGLEAGTLNPLLMMHFAKCKNQNPVSAYRAWCLKNEVPLMPEEEIESQAQRLKIMEAEGSLEAAAVERADFFSAMGGSAMQALCSEVRYAVLGKSLF